MSAQVSEKLLESEFLPFEEDLNLYLDGELPFAKQTALFSRLATDESLRSQMEAVMLFRRMSRQEIIALPPSADDRFLARLAELKQVNERFNRAEDRQPLWRANRSVSIRSALAAVTAVFVIGLLLPMSRTNGSTRFIAQEEEHVTFDTPQTRVLQSYIYVFEPGLTIEADQSESGLPARE